MATLNDHIILARNLNTSNESQFPDPIALLCANIIIHQIEDYITSAIWEGFFWDILTTSTTVAWQSEYTLPVIDTWLFNWTPKIEWISIKYADWGDFVPATEKNREILLQEHDLTRYETNISESTPIYFIADNSYFVFPSPLVPVEKAIKVYWIKSLADATLTTTDAELFWGKISPKYYYTILDGLKQYIKAIQNKETESVNARLDFEDNILPRLVDKIWNRRVGISQRWNPDLSLYK